MQILISSSFSKGSLAFLSEISFRRNPSSLKHEFFWNKGIPVGKKTFLLHIETAVFFRKKSCHERPPPPFSQLNLCPCKSYSSFFSDFEKTSLLHAPPRLRVIYLSFPGKTSFMFIISQRTKITSKKAKTRKHENAKVRKRKIKKNKNTKTQKPRKHKNPKTRKHAKTQS